MTTNYGLFDTIRETSRPRPAPAPRPAPPTLELTDAFPEPELPPGSYTTNLPVRYRRNWFRTGSLTYWRNSEPSLLA